MTMTANSHPYRVTAVEGSTKYANNHPIKVEIEGGVVTPDEFEELEKKVDALATDLSYKGGVADYDHLPQDPAQGDVYTTEDTGVLWVWDGTRWVALNDSKKAITGSTDPSSSTEGELGQLYLNTTSSKLFYCAGETSSSYTWLPVDTTYSAFTGATASTAGATGLVPAPAAGDESKVLKGDGTWGVSDAGIKTLTTADYNYPANNPTNIALWLLEPGIYQISGSGVAYRYTTSNGTTFSDKNIVIVSTESSIFNVVQAVIIGQRKQPVCYTMTTTGADYDSSSAEAGSILCGFNTVDNLLSFSGRNPLSANQGRVLNEKIGNLTTLTTTAKTSAVAAINELDSDLGKVEPLSGSGAPTTSTAGVVGQDYIDTATGDKYYLSAIVEESGQPDSYTWVKYATGSGGPTVVQTTGTSTSDVMSQNAVTSMVYADPSTTNDVKIGIKDWDSGTGRILIGKNLDSYNRPRSIQLGAFNNSTNASPLGLYGIAIGYGARGSAIGTSASSAPEGVVAIGAGARAVSYGAMAIGAYSDARANGAVAIGARSLAQTKGEVSIGCPDYGASYGYNNSDYRLLTGLYDPQSAHDAANKQYVDANSATTLTISQFNSILENA